MTNSIPSACAVDAMAVTIGTETVGFVVYRDSFIDCPLNREQLRRAARSKNCMAVGPKLTQPQN
jgi:hypothetical protein